MAAKMGIILAGGGGNGAYQAGAWKALSELGIANQINYFSGTSIGALNAILFATSDADTVERIWLEADTGDVFHKPVKKLLPKIGTLAKGIAKNHNKFQIAASLVHETIHQGIFSRGGVLKLIEKYVNFNTLQSMSRKVYATCTKIGAPHKAVRFLLNDFDSEKVKTILLASSAVPGAYKMETIGNEKYFDGAITDNIPIQPVIDDGCDTVIVISLDKNKSIDIQKFPGVSILCISPKKKPGRFFNFKNAASKIEDGYKDAMESFIVEGNIFAV